MVHRDLGSWTSAGKFKGVDISLPRDSAEILISGMEAKPYTDILFKWNRKVSDKYKITRFTFLFLTDKLDTEFKIRLWANTDDIADKHFSLSIHPNVDDNQELNFGEAVIETSGKRSELWMHIQASGISKTPYGYQWQLSNFKIYGVKI